MAEAPDPQPRRDEQPYGRAGAASPVGESPIWLLISAGLFLYVGFVLGYTGRSESQLYNTSVAMFTLMAKFVGIGLLVVFAGTVAGFRPAMILSALLAALAAVVCGVVGAIWVTHGDSEGWLLFLFAAVNGSAANSAWRMWRGAPI